MTPHRTLNIAAALLLAAVIAAALSTAHLLDQDDHQAEWTQSSALADAQKAARAEQQRERAAQQLCIRLHGPGVAVAYTIDGDVVCKARRGGGPVTVASSKGGAL